MTSIANGESGASARAKLNNILGTVFNVADFGAVADGNPGASTGTDNTTAIQAAINAANSSGGVVFFPPGGYKISSRLTVTNSQSGIIIRGCGPNLNAAGGNGTTLFGNFNDWLLTTEQVNSPQCPVKVIEGITFLNSNTTSPVSTDVTPGCIRITAGVGVAIRDCEIDVRGGIGIFIAAGQNHIITNTNFFGSYPGNANSIGAWLGSCSMENCKVQGLGTGIICGGNGTSGIIRNIDIEVSGIHMLIGHNPLPWFDSNQTYPPLSAPSDGGGVLLVVQNVSNESPFLYGIQIAQCSNALFENIAIASFQQHCNAGIGIETGGSGTVHFTRFQNIDIYDANPGGYAIAGFLMGTQVDACTFDTVRVRNNLVANVQWILPTTTGAGADPFTVTNCQGFDGALLFANRYTGPSANGMTSRFSDCPFPVWDTVPATPVSNVGRPITVGGGINNVLAAWDKAASVWRLAGP